MICLLGFAPDTFCQLASPDSTFPEAAASHAAQLYNESFADRLRLYNGIEYVDYDKYIKGHQFYESQDWENGAIHYDGVLYRNVPLHYDLMRDEVIVEHPNETGEIRLIPERVQYFSLLNHTFIRLVADSAKSSLGRTGYFDLLYDGNVQVLAKRSKEIEEKITNLAVNRTFLQKDRYFVQQSGVYHAVKSKKSVLKLFNEHKKTLAKNLRRDGIRFKTDRELAMIKLAGYYDALRKPL